MGETLQDVSGEFECFSHELSDEWEVGICKVYLSKFRWEETIRCSNTNPNNNETFLVEGKY